MSLKVHIVYVRYDDGHIDDIMVSAGNQTAAMKAALTVAARHEREVNGRQIVAVSYEGTPGMGEDTLG